MPIGKAPKRPISISRTLATVAACSLSCLNWAPAELWLLPRSIPPLAKSFGSRCSILFLKIITIDFPLTIFANHSAFCLLTEYPQQFLVDNGLWPSCLLASSVPSNCFVKPICVSISKKSMKTQKPPDLKLCMDRGVCSTSLRDLEHGNKSQLDREHLSHPVLPNCCSFNGLWLASAGYITLERKGLQRRVLLSVT